MLNFKRLVVAGALATVASAVPMMSAHASFTVYPGWDLLETSRGTMFNGIAFTGAPSLISSPGCGAAQYNFGSGCVDLATTSAIIRREAPATVSGPGLSATIPIDFVALGLRSVDPVPSLLKPGVTEYLNLTLDSDAGSTATITFNSSTLNNPNNQEHGGVFTSVLDQLVFRLAGETSGESMIVDRFPTGELIRLTQQESPWGRNPLPDQLLISGVNYLLNGTTREDDFHSGVLPNPFGLIDPGIFGEAGQPIAGCNDVSTLHDSRYNPGGDPGHRHCTRTAVVPIPGAAPLLLSGLAVFGFVFCRRKVA